MAIKDAFLGELEYEAGTTRKMLERIPESAWDFKPHEKSMGMKQLATHCAEMWGWTRYTLFSPCAPDGRAATVHTTRARTATARALANICSSY